MNVENNLLNASEVAEILGVWRDKLYKEYLNTGKLKPAMQTGRIKLYKAGDVRKLKAKLCK